jgi:hypothetical protein
MRLIAITDEDELARLRQLHNPENKPTGHFTGRCMKCGSTDLWDDASAYGCNCCGALYNVNGISPIPVCAKCHVPLSDHNGPPCA